MAKPTLVLTAAALLLLVGVSAGITAPRVPPGITEQERIFADHAVRMAQHTFSNPFQNLIGRYYVVRDIETRSTDGSCGDEPWIAEGEFEATVYVLTLFRLRVGELRVGCTFASLQWMPWPLWPPSGR